MITSEMKIGIIGGGNMGEAFIGALIGAKITDPGMILASDVNHQRLAGLHDTYHISTTGDNRRVFHQCRIIIFAVKPQQMGAVLSEIAEAIDRRMKERKILISLAAGIPLKIIEAYLYPALDDTSKKRLPVIRVMPNTPALVLSGMSGMSSNRFVTEKDRTITKSILSAMGRVIEFDEPDLDSVTALSGSGPAYVFYLVEAMIEAGIDLGLTPGNAEILTLNTLKGALALLESRPESAKELRRQVTSPGGTTEAAMGVLTKHCVKERIIEAICAAKVRAGELSNCSSVG